MIAYRCPHCGSVLSIPEKYLGQAGKCNKCGRAITVTVVPQPEPSPDKLGTLGPERTSQVPTPQKIYAPSQQSRLKQIKQQIRSLGAAGTFITKKEVAHLPKILTDDETVLALTSGLMDGNTWLAVVTQKRIVFLDKGMIYGLKQRETPIEKISSIEQATGMVFGSISIWDGASRMEIKNVMKRTVRPFVKAVNRARDALKSSEAQRQTTPQSSGVDVATQLERLAALRDQGILTEDEFKEEKRKVLSS